MAENKEVAIVFKTKRLVESLGTKVIGFAGKYGRQAHFSGNTYTILQ